MRGRPIGSVRISLVKITSLFSGISGVVLFKLMYCAKKEKINFSYSIVLFTLDSIAKSGHDHFAISVRLLNFNFSRKIQITKTTAVALASSVYFIAVKVSRSVVEALFMRLSTVLGVELNMLV